MAAKLCKREMDGVLSLPEDMILEVLVRLPAKSLCRFRCVSKRCRALISDPAFVAAQRSRARPHLIGVFFESEGRPRPEVRVMDMDGNVVRVFDVVPQRQAAATMSTIGLIVHGLYSEVIVAIDPAAGRAWPINMGMASTPPALWNFGRAAPSGAFKGLWLGDTTQASLPALCKVATIMDGGGRCGGGIEALRWRQRSAPPFDLHRSYYPTNKATVNGVIYFNPCLSDNYDEAGRMSIAAFDLESEEWNVISGPAIRQSQEKKLGYVALTELNGRLSVVQFLGRLAIGYLTSDDPFDAIIWLLVDPHKSVWVKEYTIELPKTWRRVGQLWALNDGRILFLVNDLDKVQNSTLHHRDILIFYDPGTKAFTKYMDIPSGFKDIFISLYTGSLLSYIANDC